MRSPFGRGFSLGSVAASTRDSLAAATEPVYAQLDRLTAAISSAASSALISQAVVGRWLDARDTFRRSLDRLLLDVDTLDGDADVEAWRATLQRLTSEVSELVSTVEASIQGDVASSRLSQGMWMLAVAGAGIGTVLLVRRIGRRKGR